MVDTARTGRIGRGAATLGVLWLVLCLAGCWHPALPATVESLDEDQVVGTWVHLEDGVAVSQITFQAGGLAEFEFEPSDLVELVGASKFLDASWEIREEFDGRWEVVMFGDSAQGERVSLTLGALDRTSGPVLFITLGDPDEARYYEFERQPAN